MHTLLQCHARLTKRRQFSPIFRFLDLSPQIEATAILLNELLYLFHDSNLGCGGVRGSKKQIMSDPRYVRPFLARLMFRFLNICILMPYPTLSLS